MSKNQTPPAPLPPAPAPAAPRRLERARVRSNHGPMVHLHTNTLITEDGKLIDLDSFAVAQIEAGKWSIVTD